MRKATITVFAVIVAGLGASAVYAQPIELPQWPKDVCKCNGYTGDDRGGARTYEEFSKRYGSRFPDPDIRGHAWELYDIVNRCDALPAIGKNIELRPFQNKQGYCAMRNLQPWNLEINDIYLQATLDRGGTFLLASPADRLEIMSKRGSVKPSLVDKDDDNNWKIIYNRELAQILHSGRYAIKGDLEKAEPQRPAFYEPDCVDIAGVWSGTMNVIDPGGTLIPVGQQRPVTVTLAQKNCVVTMDFNKNKLDGPFNGPGTARLDWHATGALVVAEYRLTGNELAARFEQEAKTGRVISEGVLRKK